ncbi:MAG: RodZ domain-containing protein [Candidatus Korobacteraceae bacterium]
MGSFGEKLRRERELRGVALDDIAGATKIGTRMLRALEEEHFEILPGGIFNKGFVRAYAKYLGLNEDEAVADYLAAAGDSSLDPRVIAEQNSGRIDRSGGDSGDHRAPRFPIIPVLILLLVIAAGAGGWQIYQERMRDRQAKLDAARAATTNSQPSASEATGVTNPADTTSSTGQTSESPSKAGPLNTNPTTTSGSEKASTATKSPTNLNVPAKPGESTTTQPTAQSTSATAPLVAENQKASAGVTPPANQQPFEVTVRAVDKAWVSIKSDGQFKVRGIIGPPDVKVIRATDQIVFWTGNSGAVEVSFNGQRVPLVGGPNSEGVLVFNSKGVVIPKPATPKQEP